MAEKAIKAYNIIYNLDRLKLMRDVAADIARGWTLQGGVAVTQETQGTAFAQALVLYEGECTVEEDRNWVACTKTPRTPMEMDDDDADEYDDDDEYDGHPLSGL